MLTLGLCGNMIKQAVDALTIEQARDRTAVFKAIGDAIEQYMATVLAQVTIVVPPLAGLGSISPGVLTTPGAPAIIPPGAIM